MGGGLLLALNLIAVSECRTDRDERGDGGPHQPEFGRRVVGGVHDSAASGVAQSRSGAGACRRRRARSPRCLRQLVHTLREVRRYPQTLTFMVAFLLYNDAIQTVITLASQFGHDELKIPVSQLTLAILMVQFVAFFGAMAFKWLAAAISAKRAVSCESRDLDGSAGLHLPGREDDAPILHHGRDRRLVLGGSQALSRSLYAQMIPKLKEAQYFSIYEVSDKGTSWLCPMFFGLALQFTKSYRIAILSLIIFFLAGLLVLLKVDVERGERDVAGQQNP